MKKAKNKMTYDELVEKYGHRNHRGKYSGIIMNHADMRCSVVRLNPSEVGGFLTEYFSINSDENDPHILIYNYLIRSDRPQSCTMVFMRNMKTKIFQAHVYTIHDTPLDGGWSSRVQKFLHEIYKTQMDGEELGKHTPLIYRSNLTCDSELKRQAELLKAEVIHTHNHDEINLVKLFSSMKMLLRRADTLLRKDE